MRLVTIAPFRVSPPDNGGRSLIFGAARHGASQCEAYACLAVTTLRDRPLAVPPPFPYREFPSAASLLQGATRLRLAPKVLYFRALRRQAAALARAALASRPDVVEVHLPWLASVRLHLPAAIPVVVIMHNIEALWQESDIARCAWPAYFRRMLRRMEAAALRQADHVVCLTAQDRETALSMYGVDPGRISAIPPGADLEADVPACAAHDRVRAIFVGSAFSANPAAARCLVEQVIPRLDGRSDLLVAGDISRYMPKATLPSTVRVLGRVDDLPALLRTCDVLLSPSALRTGVHMKVIEALAAGCRVISTADGARGYEALVGGPVIVAAPEAFGALVPAASRLTSAEYARVRPFAWPAVLRRRFDLYTRLAARL